MIERSRFDCYFPVVLSRRVTRVLEADHSTPPPALDLRERKMKSTYGASMGEGLTARC